MNYRARPNRGLSRLQRAILELALANGECQPQQGYVVTRRQVFEAYYGWQPVRSGMRRSSPVFSREAIGLPRYRAVQVSLSKAVKRLIVRGLVTISTQGVVLTETGIATAAALATGDRDPRNN